MKTKDINNRRGTGTESVETQEQTKSIQEETAHTLEVQPLILTIAISALVSLCVTSLLSPPAKGTAIKLWMSQLVKRSRRRFQRHKSYEPIRIPHHLYMLLRDSGIGPKTQITIGGRQIPIRIISELDVDDDGSPDVITADTNGTDVFISVKWVVAAAGAVVTALAGYMLM
uniref:Uncharacterized protein n=1 Tax=viral metagenome TaxID=1070528 RepID=A0A2V0RKN7_9ZZZZ